MFIIFFSSFIVVKAQDVKTDSTKSTVNKEVIVDSRVKEEPTKKAVKKEKEGFGETLLTLGRGFMDRLKYRFNLEAVEKKVEKFKKKGDKKKGS